MTAELREAMALAPWGSVTVKKEEEEEENFLGQASSQQVHSENIKVWAPGESPQTGLVISEQEEKVNNSLGGGRKERPEHLKWFQRELCSSASTWSIIFRVGLKSVVLWYVIETVSSD